MSKLALTDLLPMKGTTAKIPQLGFGVWDSAPDVCVTSCLNALKAGYRHIDTAQIYGNEAEVGQAVKQCGLPREQIFVTTKIIHPGDDAEKSYEKCVESIKKLDDREAGYVDLFLIHNPGVGPAKRKELWQVLERLHFEGKAKAIGVSNYGPKHIEEMKPYAKVWPPMVNQIELHPWTQQKDVVPYCEQNGIVVEAYCPIARNQRANDPTLAPIAKKLGVTPNHVLLRYCLQKNWVPLPKSDNPDRMKANADLYGFEISKEDMDTLDNLDQNLDGACCPENLPSTIP